MLLRRLENILHILATQARRAAAISVGNPGDVTIIGIERLACAHRRGKMRPQPIIGFRQCGPVASDEMVVAGNEIVALQTAPER